MIKNSKKWQIENLETSETSENSEFFSDFSSEFSKVGISEKVGKKILRICGFQAFQVFKLAYIYIYTHLDINKIYESKKAITLNLNKQN